jgi:hypothetical protein
MGKIKNLLAGCNFKEIEKSREFSDIQFVLKEEKVKSHKIILSSACKCWEILDEQNEINIDEKDEKLFKNFISYLYGSTFEYSTEEEALNFLILLSKVK